MVILTEDRTAQTLERIKGTVWKELVETFGTCEIAELEGVVAAAEEFLKQTLYKALICHADLFVPGLHVTASKDLIVVQEGIFDVHIAEQLRSSRRLGIAFAMWNLRGQLPRFVTKQFKQEGFGRFSRFDVSWPEQLRVQPTELQDLIRAITGTVYAWLKDHVTSKLMGVENELAHDLYSYARSTFQCDERLRRFWFIAVKDRKGYCLFDHRSILDVVDLASRTARGTELSASGIAAHFVTNEAEFDLMVAKEAIELGKCIDVPFAKTKYCAVEQDFSSAEAALHQADSISLYPLVREGKGFLLAGFPTPSRAVFEPLLAAHAAELAELFNHRFDALKRLTALLKRTLHGTSASVIGELLGGFTKSMMDPN